MEKMLKWVYEWKKQMKEFCLWMVKKAKLEDTFL